MAWQSGTINPATTSPAADITKITNDLAVLRSVFTGGSDPDVPVNFGNLAWTGTLFGGSGIINIGPSQFYKDAAGNIGIGTTTPSFKLEAIGAVASTRPSGSAPEFRLLQSGVAQWAITNPASSGSFSINDVGAGGVSRLLISTTGDIGIGITPSYKLDVLGDIAATRTSGTAPTFRLVQSGIASWSINNPAGTSTLDITDVGVGQTRARFGAGGEVYFPGVSTTASAANAFLNSGSTPANQLLRSTSSLRYKTDVRDLPGSYLDDVLQLRPVVYRSKAEADDQSLDWVGLIAEEVAAVAPRLVHYTTLEEGGPLVPDGVQYDRIAVLLLAVVKQQQATIEALDARINALESKA